MTMSYRYTTPVYATTRIGYNITRQITPDMGIPSACDLHDMYGRVSSIRNIHNTYEDTCEYGQWSEAAAVQVER